MPFDAMNLISRKWWQAWWTGLLVLVPATATLLILSKLFQTLDQVTRDLLTPRLIETAPGVGFVLLLLLIFLSGLVTSNFLGQRLVLWAEERVQRIPLVRTIYLTLKSMTDIFHFRSRFGRSMVAVFPFPRDGLWAIGFVMGVAPAAVQRTAGEPLAMLFVPTAIHPFTGYLAFVPARAITPINLPVEEAMKLQFSAGLYRPRGGWLRAAAPSEPPSTLR